MYSKTHIWLTAWWDKKVFRCILKASVFEMGVEIWSSSCRPQSTSRLLECFRTFHRIAPQWQMGENNLFLVPESRFCNLVLAISVWWCELTLLLFPVWATVSSHLCFQGSTNAFRFKCVCMVKHSCRIILIRGGPPADMKRSSSSSWFFYLFGPPVLCVSLRNTGCKRSSLSHGLNILAVIP